MPTIGIPYAMMKKDVKGNWYKQCPICGMRIYLYSRKDFESFTGAEYSLHFRKAHPSLVQ